MRSQTGFITKSDEFRRDTLPRGFVINKIPQKEPWVLSTCLSRRTYNTVSHLTRKTHVQLILCSFEFQPLDPYMGSARVLESTRKSSSLSPHGSLLLLCGYHDIFEALSVSAACFIRRTKKTLE